MKWLVPAVLGFGSVKKGGRVPRPRIEISESAIGQIERMAAIGLTTEKIAIVLNISPRTFFRWQKDERVKSAFARGRALAELNVGKTLYELAVVERNLAAIVWYEKTRLGRREKQEFSHTHAASDGKQVIVYLLDNGRDAKEGV